MSYVHDKTNAGGLFLWKAYAVIDHVGNCIVESTSYFSSIKLIYLQREYPQVWGIPYPANVGVNFIINRIKWKFSVQNFLTICFSNLKSFWLFAVWLANFYPTLPDSVNLLSTNFLQPCSTSSNLLSCMLQNKTFFIKNYIKIYLARRLFTWSMPRRKGDSRLYELSLANWNNFKRKIGVEFKI